jgi:iron complex outermembrane receptor protein
VTVITAEEIRHYGWRTLAEILNSQRGFYTSNDRNYTYVGVRGFLRPGDYNSRLLLLLNGHRMNDNLYDSAYFGNEFPLHVDLIDRIEIVRGPGSSLFGTDAVFAVVNVITRAPTAQPSVEIMGDVGSSWSRSGRITASVTRGRLATTLSGTLLDNPGASRLFFPEFAASQTNDGYADNIDGERAARAFWDLRYGDFSLQSLYASRFKIIPTAAYATNFNDPGTRTTDAFAYFDAEYRHSLTAATDLDLRGFFHDYDYHGTYAYGGTNSPDRYLNFDKGRADWTGIEGTLSHRMGKHRLTVGGNYQYNLRLTQKTYYAGAPPALDDRRTSWLTAAFAELELKVRRDLGLRAGGRLDYFSEYGSALSPRLGVVYLPTKSTALKYLYGRAFRAPNAYESYYSDGETQEIPAHRLQKENIEAHEVILEHSLNPWLGMTVDAYYNQLDHLIDWETDPANDMTRAVNRGQVRGRGLEFELNAKRASGLEGRASYSLSDAYDRILQQRLDNSPLHQGKLNGTIPIVRHAFAGLELLYFSPQRSYQQTRVPPSFLTNVTFSTRPLWGAWIFSASCYNAFDRRWYSPAGPNNTQSEIAGDGRAFRFKLSYRFTRGGQ